MAFSFANGVEVKSKSLDVSGIIIARSEHLYGCNRYLIQLKKRKDNTPGESWWVDEGDLVFISRGIADGKVKSNNGGPAVKHDFKRD